MFSELALTSRQEPAIEDLLTRLDGLPLALATAGAYLGLDSMPVSEYLQHYDMSWLELQQTSPKLLSYEDQTLYSTWNLSYIHIRKEDEAAAELLEIWAYFDNQDIWFDLLEAGRGHIFPAWFLRITRSRLAFKAAISILQKHALVESLTKSDGYSMHHCVYSWVKTVLWTAIESQKLKVSLTCVSETITVVPAPGDWRIKQRLLPHAERCLRLLSIWTEDKKDSDETDNWVIDFFSDLGILYHGQGKLKEAESMYQRALTGKEKALGPDHTSTLDTVNNLGALYRDQGKLKEAESMYQRALTGKEKALGPDHTSTLDTVNNLGALYRDQGKLKEAESMYQRALAGYNNDPQCNPKRKLDAYYTMALLSRTLRNFDKAVGYFEQAYEGYSKIFGPQNAKTVDALGQIEKTRKKQAATVNAR